MKPVTDRITSILQKYTLISAGIVLALITVAVYMQVRTYEFLVYDDYQYILRNPHVTNGITRENISWAFTSLDAANWHPITWLSHMVDTGLYGVRPGGHHLSNVIIHIVSTLLLLFFLFRITGMMWQSVFVAALFALHPLHVESVAWVAERKDVLSALFWFLTLFFYSEYVQKKKPGLYVLSLVSFMIGLMAKPMLITLPVIMLLMDFWPLNRFSCNDHEKELYPPSVRWRQLLKEKIPFLACSFFSGTITLYAQQMSGTMSNLRNVSLPLRIENALNAYTDYIINTFWPHDLAVHYPLPSSYPLWQVFSSLLFLIVVSVSTIRVRHNYPYLIVGWFWFLITLVPVIGIIQIGDQAKADRYTYLPLVGLFIMAAWGVARLTEGLAHRKGIVALITATVLSAAATTTYKQLGYWQDSITLFEHTLRVTTGNYAIYNNLGVAYANKGHMDAAIQAYQEALQLEPNLAEGYNNLGNALAGKGNLDGAINAYQKVLSLHPEIPETHNNLGLALAKKGHLDAAIQEYHEALRLKPDLFEAHNNLKAALDTRGK